MKDLLIIACCILFISCATSNRKGSDNKQMVWNLKNNQLKEQICSFMDSVNTPSVKEKFVWITYKSLNDSTCYYELGYCINILGLVYQPPHLFFKVNDKLVAVSVSGMNEFAFSEQSLTEIMKNNFPRQYEYYLKNGDYPPPITAREVLWRLTFQNDKLARKEVITH